MEEKGADGADLSQEKIVIAKLTVPRGRHLLSPSQLRIDVCRVMLHSTLVS